VAVEVTARETGTLGPNVTDGVGLALSASTDGSSYVAFFVLPSGEWDLWQGIHAGANDQNSYTLTSGHSSAIHGGFGATNRLLALIRGNTYLLYVNDHLVGTYTASSYDHLPTSGGAGVFLNESSISGWFTNFAVYPVQPSSSLWYV
jgi:hypothetical protein